MQVSVFSIRDRVATTFGNPFFTTGPGLAIRSFTDEVNRAAEDNLLYRHSDDFELFHLGYFDTDTAKFTIFDHPSAIISGAIAKIRDQALAKKSKPVKSPSKPDDYIL